MHDFYTQIGIVLIRCAYASYNFVCFDWKTLSHFKAHTVEKHMAQNIHQFLRYCALTSDFYLFDSSILKMYLSSCCCFENNPYISSAWRINAILFMFLANDAGESQQKKPKNNRKFHSKFAIILETIDKVTGDSPRPHWHAIANWSPLFISILLTHTPKHRCN